MRDLYRLLPPINELLLDAKIQPLRASHSRELLLSSTRYVLDRIRNEIQTGLHNQLSLTNRLASLQTEIASEASRQTRPSLRAVINATGVILHTNLGRAPLSRTALERVFEVAQGYSNLEFDLQSGERSRRDNHAEDLLLRLLAVKTNQPIDELTRTHRAILVNNCAAATFLALNTLAEGSEVIVSRGELVEIGGGFRIPDILRKSGAILKEVGTTNRTRLSDYESAISPATRLILRVHQSNFSVHGFTERPTLANLIALAKKTGISLFEDQGTGSLTDLDEYGIPNESSLLGSFRQGPDLIAASGDKLLGGPQCGILLGRNNLIEAIQRNSLLRTFRVDKLTYAALEGTLIDYLSGNLASIPLTRMLAFSPDDIRARCQAITVLVSSTALHMEVLSTSSVIGGGTTPGAVLPSFAIAIQHTSMSADVLSSALRQMDPPLVARIGEDRVLLDLRTVPPESDGVLISHLNAIRIGTGHGNGPSH